MFTGSGESTRNRKLSMKNHSMHQEYIRHDSMGKTSFVVWPHLRNTETHNNYDMQFERADRRNTLKPDSASVANSLKARNTTTELSESEQ